MVDFRDEDSVEHRLPHKRHDGADDHVGGEGAGALQAELPGAFTVRSAREAGLPPARLRSRALMVPFRGVRAPRNAPATTVLDRCRLLAPRLTGAQFFCHVTAASLWGMPLPGWTTSAPLHVGAHPPAREPRLPGVVGHRLSRLTDDLTLRHGLPVTAPATTWALLGAALAIDPLIIAADHLLTARLVDLDELRDAVVPGARGAVRLREALDAVRVGSESPRETETRLLLVRAGLPEPALNWSLHDDDGRFVARLDLAYPSYRVCVEYDGRHHASIDQFARDADRWAAIEQEGWVLIRVLSHHFTDPARLIVPRVQRALISRGWR
ncbi:endonuclease domain-containing protein [Microbacterium sp. TNHR37B]|uniref:endonuclease domain-containing protein n=1 Tax=Microbacterium sp. TNHR37B TaxID=1775956 RepID=UPI0007B2878E|nr:hypothetical protein [Microbacterium sp. TNHR37B]KZE88744.1 hypothetical protein AVP41_03251 [Microbacterium sp. TNHR37B]